ncbi:hypothetical protein DDN06_11960 [Vibrio cholerae]|nr:hypothetical protein [Vibrio cholerae]EGR1140641.1 hypothetical protein [Vibrio cholerae]EGR2017301.1 hypothetical protein [Vibrio cholerae]EGR2438503.1 hypothetical protein [Vibrio cholerae]EGR2490491.1 hypothetical protein [Vibrio cholerae]
MSKKNNLYSKWNQLIIRFIDFATLYFDVFNQHILTPSSSSIFEEPLILIGSISTFESEQIATDWKPKSASPFSKNHPRPPGAD